MTGLERITPVLLTFQEELNVGRTLESLTGFSRVVVLDSGSTDSTERVVRSFPNVSWFVRPFDNHIAQWTFALSHTEVESEFVLALDADMSMTAALSEELAGVSARGDIDGGVIGFEYRIRGRALRGSLYPPQLRLMRRGSFEVANAGHTQEFRVAGKAVRLSSKLVHDDRKGLDAFVRAQVGYSARELPRLFEPGIADEVRSRLRRGLPLTPLLIWLLAWLRAGGPFGGPAARRYALERLIYESLLRWRIEDGLLAGGDSGDPAGPGRGSGEAGGSGT